MGLICLVCACETDLSYYLALPEETPFSCPQCDGFDPSAFSSGPPSASGSDASSPSRRAAKRPERAAH
jgi:hypothetical protein